MPEKICQQIFALLAASIHIHDKQSESYRPLVVVTFHELWGYVQLIDRHISSRCGGDITALFV